MKNYNFQDLKQASIGSFISILVFFAIRGGSPFFFKPIFGVIISVFVVWIYWNGFNIKHDTIHFIINLIVAFAICAAMGIIFELITLGELFSLKVFGSLIIIGWWVSIPLALIFDQYNFTNPLRRFYVRGR